MDTECSNLDPEKREKWYIDGHTKRLREIFQQATRLTTCATQMTWRARVGRIATTVDAVIQSILRQ